MNEPTRLLIDAAERLAAERPNRHRPSPSSISTCTRQNWFSETGVAPTETPDAEAFVSAESGRLSESVMTEIVNESGLLAYAIEEMTENERELSAKELTALSLRGGQFDRVGYVPGGEKVLVEFKRKGVRDFLSIARDGLREADPKDYDQVQVLMAALGLKRCLIFICNWDRGQLTAWQQRDIRAGEARIPGLYAEWIQASAPAAIVAAKRAKMQLHYIEHEKQASRVPRDFDPMNNKFPCTWCLWRSPCLAAEGIKRTPGRMGDPK